MGELWSPPSQMKIDDNGVAGKPSSSVRSTKDQTHLTIPTLDLKALKFFEFSSMFNSLMDCISNLHFGFGLILIELILVLWWLCNKT